MAHAFEKSITDLFSLADVRIQGDRPGDIHVHDPRFYRRVLAQGSLGLGDSYMDGWWTCDQIDQFIFKLITFGIDRDLRGTGPALLWQAARAKLMNLQTRARAYEVGKVHYDTGNDFFQAMLDKRMVYSCGYWKEADNLDDAQEAKLDLVCRKIGLTRGQTILDIGCGWGSFVQYAAENYGVEAVGITISKEQAESAKERCRGLPITIKVMDYRSLSGTFDHVISLGMFEHVGYKNYRTYMNVVHKSLKDDGLFLLHTIGQHTSKTSNDPWLDKHIFPNAMSPSTSQITGAIEGLFALEDWHCFGANYYETIMAWYQHVVDGRRALKEKYGDRFYRMWTYSLQLAAGSFAAGGSTLWQIVLSKKGTPGGYVSIR